MEGYDENFTVRFCIGFGVFVLFWRLSTMGSSGRILSSQVSKLLGSGIFVVFGYLGILLGVVCNVCVMERGVFFSHKFS